MTECYIEVNKAELSTSNKLLGYRSMWQLIRDKYRLTVRRYTLAGECT